MKRASSPIECGPLRRGAAWPDAAPAPRRRALLALLGAAALAGCGSVPTGPANTATNPAADATNLRAVLAPSGRLRVGVYLGSPSSLVRGADGQPRGVTVDLGQALAQRLGVPFELVEFPRIAAVLEALKAGQLDFTVTNATPARAAELDFSPALLDLELGYLALPGSPVQSIDTVDRPGVRIGVSQGSSSQGVLTKQFQAATVLPAASLKQAAEMLSARQIDAFATNKAILFELADGLPGARVLPGRWGLEHLAIALPKGRAAGLGFVRAFADEARRSGVVQRAADRAGLRGTVPPAP